MTKILVVDDDAPIRGILRRILEKASYEVIEAENGADGLNKALEEKPDLVLTDLVMPRVGGLTLTANLVDAGFTSPIVLLTSEPLGGQDHLNDFLSAGGSDFLRKPFNSDLLLAVVARLLKPKEESER